MPGYQGYEACTRTNDNPFSSYGDYISNNDAKASNNYGVGSTKDEVICVMGVSPSRVSHTSSIEFWHYRFPSGDTETIAFRDGRVIEFSQTSY